MFTRDFCCGSNKKKKTLKIHPGSAHSLVVWVLLMLTNAKQCSSLCRHTNIALSFSSAATMEESVSFACSLLNAFSQKLTPTVMLMPYGSVCQWSFQFIPSSVMPLKTGCCTYGKLFSSACSCGTIRIPAICMCDKCLMVQNHHSGCFKLFQSHLTDPRLSHLMLIMVT